MEDPRTESEAYFQQAYTFQMQGRLEEAIEYYKKSIDICPTAEAHTFLGWTYSFQGRIDEAIEECYKAIAIDPDYGNPYNDIGAYLIQKGDLKGAIPWLGKAKRASRYESRAHPYANMARIYERLGMWWKAMAEYEAALREQPGYAQAEQGLRGLRAHFN